MASHSLYISELLPFDLALSLYGIKRLRTEICSGSWIPRLQWISWRSFFLFSVAVPCCSSFFVPFSCDSNFLISPFSAPSSLSTIDLRSWSPLWKTWYDHQLHLITRPPSAYPIWDPSHSENFSCPDSMKSRYMAPMLKFAMTFNLSCFPVVSPSAWICFLTILSWTWTPEELESFLTR